MKYIFRRPQAFTNFENIPQNLGLCAITHGDDCEKKQRDTNTENYFFVLFFTVIRESLSINFYFTSKKGKENISFMQHKLFFFIKIN